MNGTWKDTIKCFFGHHPRNPRCWISELAYYVTKFRDDEDWYRGWIERCPRCKRWHYSKELNKEMCTSSRFESTIHLAPSDWRDGIRRWSCGAAKQYISIGTEIGISVTCDECLLIIAIKKALDKQLKEHRVFCV